uniref:Uncharacterized protein n=1 Tax=Anguilla anguilla TaxID=7936 RepID=A0A0E9SEU7_ANGAN
MAPGNQWGESEKGETSKTVVIRCLIKENFTQKVEKWYLIRRQ